MTKAQCNRGDAARAKAAHDEGAKGQHMAKGRRMARGWCDKGDAQRRHKQERMQKKEKERRGQ